MGGLLKVSRVIDAVNDRFGTLATWLVLFACLISTGNAISRYAFNTSSNAWLEVQWYMFAAMVFFGAPYTLKVNEHVRVDVIYSALVGARADLDRHRSAASCSCCRSARCFSISPGRGSWSPGASVRCRPMPAA